MPATSVPPPQIPRREAMRTVWFGLVWAIALADWMWVQPTWLILQLLHFLVFAAALPISIAWVYWVTRPERRHSLTVAVISTIAYVPIWQASVYFCDLFGWDETRTHLARVGTTGQFFIGLAWMIWWVERAAQRFEAQRRRREAEGWLVGGENDSAADAAGAALPARSSRPFRGEGDVEDDLSTVFVGDVESGETSRSTHTSHPLDPAAWYYGRRSPRLNQSVAALSGYTVVFLLLFLFFTRMNGCQELYEMPAGGGEQQTIAQQVKIQKVIKKKFVVNPYSAISFKVPPIDEVKLQLTEITEHAYTVGYGEGAGAGFAGGTNRGQVRFIRLEYAGGDWDQDFGIGADVNMLIEYGIRTKQKVAKRTESRTIAQLRNFPPEKSPPLVYLTGQRNISMSDSEIKVLREYLLEKRGMIFGDNGGSGHFHNQFVGMMRRVLPSVRPSRIPLDDVIHRVPFQIPFLPYVAPHGGKDALGWRVDGRLVCYYHPGDIGDAWTDDHSGVSPEIYEACYQLGTNVIFYAHAEYSKWLHSRQQRKK